MTDRFSSGASRVAVALAGLFVSLISASCGPSASDAKRDAAVQKMMNRPKPGYVRLLNLTNRSADLNDGDRPLNTAIAPGTASRFAPLRAGKGLVSVRFIDKAVDVSLTVESGSGSTIVIVPGDKTAIVADEPIRPLGDANVHVAFLSGGNSSALPKAAKGSEVVELKPDKTGVALSPGSWSVSGSGLDGSVEMNVEETCAYTIILVKGNAGLRPFFLLNTDNIKPVSGSAS